MTSTEPLMPFPSVHSCQNHRMVSALHDTSAVEQIFLKWLLHEWPFVWHKPQQMPRPRTRRELYLISVEYLADLLNRLPESVKHNCSFYIGWLQNAKQEKKSGFIKQGTCCNELETQIRRWPAPFHFMSLVGMKSSVRTHSSSSGKTRLYFDCMGFKIG